MWHQNPVNHSAMWQQMGSTQLNLLIASFQLIINPQLSLETVRETMRLRFATLSNTYFHCGQCTSVHNILLTLLNTNFSVIKITQHCVNPAHATLNETTTTTAVIQVSTPPQSLQAIINHFQEVLPSRCPSCNEQQLRQTKIVSHPPLPAFEWGINTPVLNNTLRHCGWHHSPHIPPKWSHIPSS
ncbi:hypothetical protein L208DRAFT_1475488 [Tricholoma matsutake]|nr:hypothetical protein L208DRAFT_1475488 [Tricholoma matsutake 945]